MKLSSTDRLALLVSLVLVGLSASLLFGAGGLGRRWITEYATERGAIRMMRDHWEMLDRVATSIGDSTATRGIVVFTDYRCEFCREFREVEVALKGTGATTEEPRFVYRLTPRSGDQVAAWAARAAWCSGQQSSFAQMHDHLSATTAWMSDTSAEAVVRSAAIADGVRFKECLTSVEAQSAIAADVALMRELGGTGTPFFAVPDIGTHLGVPDTVMVRRWHASVVAAY